MLVNTYTYTHDVLEICLVMRIIELNACENFTHPPSHTEGISTKTFNEICPRIALESARRYVYPPDFDLISVLVIFVSRAKLCFVYAAPAIRYRRLIIGKIINDNDWWNPGAIYRSLKIVFRQRMKKISEQAP